MTTIAIETTGSPLRSQVAKLRQELTHTTEAYRKAVAQHDSASAIPLLRSRSQLMRQLLETQCELLLSLRSGLPEPSRDAPEAAERAG